MTGKGKEHFMETIDGLLATHRTTNSDSVARSHRKASKFQLQEIELALSPEVDQQELAERQARFMQSCGTRVIVDSEQR